MRRVLAIILLSACGTAAPRASTPPPTPAPPTTAPPPDPTLPPITPSIVHNAHPDGPITSPHGGGIVAVATTADGSAALTADELGGVRLWPALDGSKEPVAIDLPPGARDLALGKRADGFTAITLDEVGGVTVTVLDRDGRQRSHATFPAEPAFTSVVMTTAGPLVMRSDQTFALLGDDGAMKQRIATESGQHVIGLAASGAHAIAIVETATGKRARWLELEPKLAWGSSFALPDDATPEIACSPSGKRVAFLDHPANQMGKAQVIDVAKPAKPIAEMPMADLSLDFVDDDHVVVSGTNGVGIWDVRKTPPQLVPVPVNMATGRATVAVVPGRIVAANDGELELATADAKVLYLGYEIAAPKLAASAWAGHLLVGLDSAFALLDAKLEPTDTKLALGGTSTVGDLRWLGGDDWAAEVAAPDGTTQLALLDAVRGGSEVARDKLKSLYVLGYEPSTHLLTLSMGAEPEVDRYDPKSRKLERIAGLASKGHYENTMFVPLAPKLAGGLQLVRLTLRDKLRIEWLKDPRALDRASVVATADAFAGADPAGHVYAWNTMPNGKLELLVFGPDGKVLATLPTDGPVGLWPDPQGTRVVAIAQRTVTMYTVQGKPLWAQAIGAATEAVWLDDGAVAIVSSAGIARLDANTGAITAARCGWRFGLSTTPHPPGPRVEPVCATLGR